MDKSIRKTVEVLRDLVKINNDRMEAYNDAAAKFPVSESDLKSVFIKMTEDGKKLSAELVTELMAHGGEPGEQPTEAGAVYHEWMDINLLLSGVEREEVLDFCEDIEDAMLLVYENALQQEDITETAISLLQKQRLELLQDYLQIKQLRGRELAYYF